MRCIGHGKSAFRRERALELGLYFVNNPLPIVERLFAIGIFSSIELITIILGFLSNGYG